MISLKENRAALLNLKATINALDNFDLLIEYYSKEKPPVSANVEFQYIDGPGKVSIEFDRKTILSALRAQKSELVEYLKSLGIQA